MKNKPNILLLSLLFILGIILSAPPFNWSWLQWFCYIPFFMILKNIRWRWLPLWGFLTFFIINLFLLFWIKENSSLAYYLAAGSFSLLQLFFLFLTKQLINRGHYFVLPLLLTVFDYLRSLGPYGFPLMVAGYSQYQYLYLIQIAAFGGVWAVSLLLYSFNTLGLLFLETKKLKFLAAGILLILITLSSSLFFQEKSLGQIKVGLIQPNINMYLNDWEQNKDIFFKAYEQLSLVAAQEKPQLIIWPETSIGLSLRKDKAAAKKLREIIEKTETDYLIGNVDERMFSLRYQEKYNSAFYINKKGVVVGEHYKEKLIPFIETINYQLLLPLNIRNNLTAGIFLKGYSQKPLAIKEHGYLATVVICYEAVFGNIVRKTTRQGANIIYNLSSDGWSSSLAEHQLNFMVNVFRAIENRLYLVRVSDNGISAIISPRGKILAQIPAFQQGTIVKEVPLLKNSSFYSQHGDLIIAILAALILIYFIVKIVNK